MGQTLDSTKRKAILTSGKEGSLLESFCLALSFCPLFLQGSGKFRFNASLTADVAAIAKSGVFFLSVPAHPHSWSGLVSSHSLKTDWAQPLELIHSL